MVGSIYDVLGDFGYTYDKYDEEKHCYIKGNISIYVMDIVKEEGIMYDCSVYMDGVFYENSHTDQELSDLLKVIDRDGKIDKLIK